MRTEVKKSAGRLMVMLVSTVVWSLSAATAPADEKEILIDGRTWTTKDGKHKVRAELVSYSVADITLKLETGKIKKIKLGLMSDEDVKYCQKFPELKGDADPKNLPWVRTQAKTKTAMREGNSGGVEYRKKSMEVSVSNRSKQKLDLTVFYGFMVEDLDGRNSSSRQTRITDLVPAGFSTKRVTLEGQKDMKFVTAAITTIEHTVGKRKYGDKAQSFIVQVYWEGQLLDGWAADSNLKSIARDGDMLDRYRGRGRR